MKIWLWEMWFRVTMRGIHIHPLYCSYERRQRKVEREHKRRAGESG